MSNKKTCPGCKEILPLEEFWKDRHKKNSRQSRCKKCMSARFRCYSIKNKDRLRQWRRHRAIRLKNKNLNPSDSGESVCSKCKMLLPLSMFGVLRSSPCGRRGSCKPCVRESDRSRYQADRIHQLERVAEYRRIHPDKLRETKKRQYKKTPERLRRNPALKLLSSARSRLWAILKNNPNKCRASELIGCSPSHLKLHIESQFKPGWTWADWGPVFHIDHIKPCASFDMTDPAQQRACFHYTNLQPLEKELNLKKGRREIAA